METKQNGGILLVGYEVSANAHLRSELLARSYQIVTANHAQEGLAKANSRRFDVIVADLCIPKTSGLDLVRQLRPAKPSLPIILIDKDGEIESAIEATKLGVFEYVTTPFEMLKLVEHIVRAASNSRFVAPSMETRRAEPAYGLVGSSRVMAELYRQIGLVAGSSVTVLIRGATGTGKELVARAIHEQSKRANRPFVCVNCSAIPEPLLENELFGHEAGAFTGARARRLGMFERAHTGTLLLDEIGDLTPGMQVKLLRVLQEQQIQRLGGPGDIQLDVRIIAATHRDLENLIEAGKFREDLFYRLNGFTVRPPALHEHPEDIPELAYHFLRKWQMTDSVPPLRICPQAIHYFATQPWPGNIRELEYAVRRAALLAQGHAIELKHVKEACGHKPSPPTSTRPYRPEPLTDLFDKARAGEIKNLRQRLFDQLEHAVLERAMSFAKGNHSKVARWLGVTRTTVRQNLRKFGITPNNRDESPQNPKRTD